MRPNPVPTPADGETDLFRNRLDNMIDMRHELVRLAGLIDWKRFDEAFGGLYAEKGRPGLPTRLMVGLHLLKHARGLSDEQVCAQWIENAYFQFFCGETYFQTKLPLDRTSMSVWRGRIGAEKLELAARRDVGCGHASQGGRPIADAAGHHRHDGADQSRRPSDRQPSAVAGDRMAEQTGQEARRRFPPVLSAAGEARPARGRPADPWPRPQTGDALAAQDADLGRPAGSRHRAQDRRSARSPAACAPGSNRVKRFLAQKPDDKNKLYALHAPEVECIAKGKASTRYEFGVKMSIAVTNARADGGQFVARHPRRPGSSL